MKKFLTSSRYLLILPVIGCVLLTAGVVVMGIGRMATTGMEAFKKGDFSIKASKQLSIGVIEIIDLFLVGTVAYIAAIGIYKLFISDVKIDMPMRLKIDSLNDLENKIIGVIIAALAVAFLGQAASGDDPSLLLNYGGGIALVIGALSFFLLTNKGSKKKKKIKEE